MTELINHSLVFSEKSAKFNLLLELKAKKQIKNLYFISGLTGLTQVKNIYPFFLYKKFNLKPDLSKRIKKYLTYIDVSKTYPDQKINQLKEIKLALLKQKIISDIDIKPDHNIVALDQALVPKFIKDYDEINYFNIEQKPITLLNCKNPIEQIYAIYETIVGLLESGVDINKIKIVNTNDKDDYQLQKILNDAKIPLTINKAIQITKFPIYKAFKEKFLTESVDDIKTFLTHNKEKHPQVIKKIISEFNRYKDDLIKNNKTIFIYQLEQLTIEPKKYQNSIEIIQVEDIDVYSEKHYLLANYIDEIFPKKVIDNDYLTDEQKNQINYFTSEALNKHALIYHAHLLNAIKNLHLFMPKKIIDQTREARLKLSRKINLSEYNYLVKSKTYLDKLNYLRYAKIKYNFSNYNLKTNDYPILNQYYQNECKLFNPQFKGINQETLAQLLMDYSLTGAKLETLKLCPFQYFLNYLLRIGENIDNHYLYFGNTIHEALENIALKPDFDYKAFVYNKKDFPEDILYKQNIYHDILIDIIAYIANETNEFHQLTQYKKLLTEEKFNFKLDENDRFLIKGIIDKIMIDTKNKYFSIIDYKFSDKTFSINEFNRGLKQQLPFYLFAYQHISELKPSGLFYQQTSKNREKVSKKSDNRLNGIYLNDVKQMKRFDPSGDFILGLSYTNSGLRKSPRALSEEEFNQVTKQVKTNINQAAKKIESGDFEIKPILSEEQNNTSISCVYCEFASVCYLKNKNVKGVNDEVYN